MEKLVVEIEKGIIVMIINQLCKKKCMEISFNEMLSNGRAKREQDESQGKIM